MDVGVRRTKTSFYDCWLMPKGRMTTPAVHIQRNVAPIAMVVSVEPLSYSAMNQEQRREPKRCNKRCRNFANPVRTRYTSYKKRSSPCYSPRTRNLLIGHSVVKSASSSLPLLPRSVSALDEKMDANTLYNVFEASFSQGECPLPSYSSARPALVLTPLAPKQTQTFESLPS